MATLQKLVIGGIRSFGPHEDDMQKITFTSPLNLFLGQNGCGKTTIIEALKFVCTGELPAGSNNGQGFVNDPKMSSQSCIKGHIQLLITDIKNNKYLITKNVQVIQTPKGLSFKRLESLIKWKTPDGIEKSISSRCVDTDSHCLQLMGLSAPIINNVIFCHQENSTWPLDEAKKLKEKFDEIFDSVKYNKCIDSLKKCFAEKQEAVKRLQIEVKYKENNKNFVENERAKLHNKEEQIICINNDIIAKKNHLDPVLKRIDKISKLEENLGKLQSSLDVKKNEKKNLLDQQQQILKNIKTEYEGSDEDLKNDILSFNNRRHDIGNEIKNLNSKLGDFRDRENELSSSISKIQINLGKLTEEQKQFEITCTDRTNLLIKLKNNLLLPGMYDFKETYDVQRGIMDLKMLLKESEKSLHTLSTKHESVEDDLEKTIGDIRNKVSEMQLNIKSKKQQSDEYKTKLTNIENQLSDLNVSDEQLKNICEKINKIDQDFDRLKSSFDQNAVMKNIEENKMKLRELENELEVVEGEYKLLSQNNVVEAELEKTKHDISKLESEIYKLKNRSREEFEIIFSGNVPDKNLKKQVQKHQQEFTNEIFSLNSEIRGTENICATLQAELKMHKKKLKATVDEFNANKNRIDSICEGKPFNDLLKEVYNAVEQLQKDKGQYSSGQIIYEKFINAFENDSTCPVCHTKQEKVIVKEIIKSLKAQIQDCPMSLKRVEKELKSKQDLYKQILQLKPINEKLDILSSETIPNLEKEIECCEFSFKNHSKQLNDLKLKLKCPQEKDEICNKLVSDATLIDQHYSDINNFRNNIESLSDQLVNVSSNRSRQETETLIENMKLDIKNLRHTYEDTQKRLDQHKNRCHEYREQRSKLVEKQLNIQKAMQGKPQLQDQFNEYAVKNNSLSNEIKQTETLLGPLQKDLDNATETKALIRQQNKEAFHKAQTEHNGNVKIFDEIMKLHKNVESFISNRVKEKINNAVEDLANKTNEKDNVDKIKQEITNSISEQKIKLANWDSTLRNYQDNVELREKRARVILLSVEIENLTSQLGSSNYKTLMQEKIDLLQKCEELNREVNELNGQKSELEKNIKEKKSELEKPENKNAYKHFKHTFFELKVNEKLAEDVKLYMMALERSLIEFHGERMKLINKRIRELWHSIYRGNDIDYIQIKTEEPEFKVSIKRRVYNYRVVQVKRGVELEMRGRCSAGQKILACLVIRMALAETFSKNCGILALDEPTTNLDKENITSLSQALARIVQSRQTERNFQLLVITHDEEFLETLKHVEGVSHYWNVSRNEDGYSVITEQGLY